MIPRNKQQRKPGILIAGVVAALFCSAGIATIMDWGVSAGKTPGERNGLIALLSKSDADRGAMNRHDTHHAVTIAPSTARCAGCGVIESILVVEMRDETTEVCAADDWADRGFGNDASIEAGARNLATLAEIVADVVVRNATARKMQSAARYELTIRFRDGARSTIRLASEPRWQPGEQVRVINNQT